MIITDRNQIDNSKILVMTSIGGAPIHEGHCRILKSCKNTTAFDGLRFEENESLSSITERARKRYHNMKLLVVVNCDDFLLRKHGYSFQNENSRAEIIDSIKEVDYTFIHQSNKQDISDCIHYFQPHYFCKGGDRSLIENLPIEEREALAEYGVVFIGGVGGTEKVSSSSDLMKRCAKHYLFEKHVNSWLDNKDMERFTQGEFPKL